MDVKRSLRAGVVKLLDRVVNWGLNRFSDAWFRRIVIYMIDRRLRGQDAARALRFLLSLDTALYGMEGQLSVVYGGGIHTKHRHMKYHDFFTARVGPTDRVLDIGCGNGAVAYDVAQVARHVVGIDLSEENIRTARRRYRRDNLEFRVGDALQALPEEAFDVVILSNVLEHLPERSEFLRRLREMLHPDRILIRVPLFERDWRVPLKKELGIEWRLDETHEIEYTLETFVDEVSAAGLQVDHMEVRWGEIWAQVS